MQTTKQADHKRMTVGDKQYGEDVINITCPLRSIQTDESIKIRFGRGH